MSNGQGACLHLHDQALCWTCNEETSLAGLEVCADTCTLSCERPTAHFRYIKTQLDLKHIAQLPMMPERMLLLEMVWSINHK